MVKIYIKKNKKKSVGTFRYPGTVPTVKRKLRDEFYFIDLNVSL